jgi:hypothetical protein
MRPLLRLLATTLAAIALYGVAFGFVIHKPLTIDEITDQLRLKEDYARQAPSPKLVVFAGSNARFSHSCRTMEPILGMACVNFGIARGIGLDYLANELEPLLRPGDVIYMPLEYDWYLDDKVAAMTGPDAALMVWDDKLRLLRLGPERAVRAFFSFDIAFAASGLAEMTLQALGVRRRIGVQTMTANGDEHGHTRADAAPYRPYVDSVVPPIPTAEAVARPSYAQQQIASFLAWAKEHGVVVYGGLQTTFDDAPVGPDLIAQIRRIYESNGQRFLLLPSRSQYKRDCFFDTFAHLVEECQIAHSVTLANALASALRDR